MLKRVSVWIVAVLITVVAAYWQRISGPTYPLKASVELAGKSYAIELLRSHEIGSACEIRLKIENPTAGGSVYVRRYPTDEPWTEVAFARSEDALTAELPSQPAAGKLEYYATLSSGDDSVTLGKQRPVVIRFKGAVPAWALWPHMTLMFAAMLIANVAGIYALLRDGRFRFHLFLAFALLTVGGMVLGPVVQQYAFGALWTGVPFGWDLTDNKTLIAFAALLIAVLGNIKRERPYLALAAALVVLVVFMIPHSMFGSELDFSTGKIGSA